MSNALSFRSRPAFGLLQRFFVVSNHVSSTTHNSHDASAHSTGDGATYSLPAVDGPPERFSERLYDRLPTPLAKMLDGVSSGPKRDALLGATLPVCAAALPNLELAYSHGTAANLYTMVAAPSGAGKGQITRSRRLGKEIERRTGDDAPDGPFYRPGNTSATALIEGLNQNPFAAVHETELQTLDASLRGGSANGREILRKGCRGETVSLNRSAKASIPIRAPAPSVVLSGTPGQVSDFLESDEGLFSRISLCWFDVEPEWRSQFGAGSAGGGPWDELADRMATARTQLAQRDRPLPVAFASGTRQVIDRAHRAVQERWKDEGVERKLPSALRRSGLRAARMAAVLHLIERVQNNTDLRQATTVEVPESTGRAGTRMALTHLIHSARLGTRLGLGRQVNIPDPVGQLPSPARKFYDLIPPNIVPKHGLRDIAKEHLGVRAPKVNRWLQLMVEVGALEKMDDCYYKPDEIGFPSVREDTSTSPDDVVAAVLGHRW